MIVKWIIYLGKVEQGTLLFRTSPQSNWNLQTQALSSFGTSPYFDSHKQDNLTRNSKESRNHQLENGKITFWAMACCFGANDTWAQPIVTLCWLARLRPYRRVRKLTAHLGWVRRNESRLLCKVSKLLLEVMARSSVEKTGPKLCLMMQPYLL